MGLSFFLIGIIMLAVIVSLCFGWLIPLIIGLVKWQRKTGAKGWFVGAGIWASLAAAFIGFAVFSTLTVSRKYAPDEFKAESYSGDLATLVLPYSGSGTVSVRQVDTGKSLRVPFSNTNCVAVPAGTLAIWHLTYQDTHANGDVSGSLSCSFQAKEDIVAHANDVITLPGGVPLTASVTAKKVADDKIQINYVLKDVAGNRLSLWGGSSGQGKPRFEALGPDGTCFWSGELEYG